MGHHLDGLSARHRRARSAVVLLLTCTLAVAAAAGSGAAAWPGVATASDAPAATGSTRVDAALTPNVALVLREQPRAATLNTTLDPPLVVTVVDAAGTPVPDAGVESVEVALRNPPGVLGVLGGRTSVPVVDGEAILDDLRIRTTGQGYHLDGRFDESRLVATEDARGVRLEHAEVAPLLSVGRTHPDDPAADALLPAAVSGRSLLLAADEQLSVLTDRLLPSSPLGVWLLGDPPCPFAASAQPDAPSAMARQVDGVGDLADPDGDGDGGPVHDDAPAADALEDAAMVEVAPVGTVTVSAAGTAQDTIALPEGLTPGAFTVQLVGTLADGRSMVTAVGVLLTPPAFPDVDPAGVHTPAIRRMAALDITTGRADGTFGPATTVTRGQLASFLARALELDTGGQPPFPDARGTVHEGAVAAVAEAGIVSGYADGSFGVGDPIRRDQLASMLAAAAGLAPQPDGPFIDLGANVHAPAVNAVAGAGIAFGDGQGRYRPAAPVRRDQQASFLARLLDLEA